MMDGKQDYGRCPNCFGLFYRSPTGKKKRYCSSVCGNKFRCKQYRATNPDGYQDWITAKDYEYKLLRHSHSSAKAKGLEHTLTSIYVPEVCPILGLKLEFGRNVRSDASPSVDRVDNAIGYVPGNVRVICWKANRLKSNATVEELSRILQYMKGEL